MMGLHFQLPDDLSARIAVEAEKSGLPAETVATNIIRHFLDEAEAAAEMDALARAFDAARAAATLDKVPDVPPPAWDRID